MILGTAAGTLIVVPRQPKTAAERKAAERDRYRSAGLVKVEVWIHPDDRERLSRYVGRLAKERA